MRLFALGILIGISTGFVSAQSSIRQVDFKNFSYPLSGPLLGHDDLKWLGDPKDGYSKRAPIHLVNGKDLNKASSFVMEGHEYIQWEGFELQSVQYADVTGEGAEDAVVVLLYETGGTQTTNYVYIFKLEGGKPKLRAYCHTGDRAYSGLYKVYGQHGLLVFELLDPQKRQGDCCSSRIIRTRYRWQNSRFVRVGIPEYRPVEGP
jgi:hypothetical protein